MCFRLLLILIGLTSSFYSSAEEEKDHGLQIKPNTCVALNEGRKCFATVKVEWKTPLPGDYCLYIEGQRVPLRCWEQKQQGQLQFEFGAEQTTKLQLKDKTTLVFIGEVKVDWLYKSRQRRRNWRLF